MTADGLAGGRVVQYRTLQANLPSVAVARRLSFKHFAHTLAVRPLKDVVEVADLRPWSDR
jgi:hypothetical protein